MSGDSFTDLRLNRQEGQVSESFWPSFTDIMTTVVMIFLIAMVVLLVRNMELVNQLRSTMEAERVAAELARATGEENSSLAVALHRAEDRIRQMRLEIQRLQAKGLDREAVISEQLTALSALTNERDNLTQRVAQVMLAREQLESDLKQQQLQLRTATSTLENRELELEAARADSANLRSNVTSLEELLAAAQKRAGQLQDDLASAQQQRDADRLAASEMERKYLVLVGDFDALKGKYDKLIRPARSATGRHLVEVRYSKVNGQFKISWREGDQGEYQPIKRKRLDLVLTRLSKEYENGLYVRVIFPENAGLSYDEAWEFTSHVHRNFDYYFKEEPQKTE